MWRSGLVALVVFSLLTLGAVATMVALSGAAHEQQGWNAFDLVVVPATASIEELHAALDAEGLAPISAANATIRVEDFNGQAELPIADLSQRFDDADPRLDPFVRAVMRLFSIRQGETDSHVMYLPRSSSIFRRYRAINAAFEGTPFYLAGWQPMARVLSAVAAFLILFGVVVRARRRPVLSSTIAIFAVTYVFLQGPVALVGGVLTATGVMYAVQLARSVGTGVAFAPWSDHVTAGSRPRCALAGWRRRHRGDKPRRNFGRPKCLYRCVHRVPPLYV